MYSSTAGSGRSSEPSGSQIRAERRVPSASGIQVWSITRWVCGKSVTMRATVAPQYAQGGRAARRCVSGPAGSRYGPDGPAPLGGGVPVPVLCLAELLRELDERARGGELVA